jgi:3',5'-cyclic AMP phosphodiesterase CpdA
MWVLQVSDLHIDSEALLRVEPTRVAGLLCENVKQVVHDGEPLVVAFCGDATSRGKKSNYLRATQILRAIHAGIGTGVIFCVCPGNHDICRDEQNPFSPFNQFARQLGCPQFQSFDLNLSVYKCQILDTDFILANSAYHLDHTYGRIDVPQLDAVLRHCNGKCRILIIHHHFIPVDGRTDGSTMVNSYEVLSLAVAHKVAAILHGHRHMQSILSVGATSCSVLGVGSLFFPPDRNLNNQFNLLRFEGGRIVEAFAFRLVDDLNQAGSFGGFLRTPIGTI